MLVNLSRRRRRSTELMIVSQEVVAWSWSCAQAVLTLSDDHQLHDQLSPVPDDVHPDGIRYD